MTRKTTDRTDELLARIEELSAQIAELKGEATGLRRTRSLTEEVDRLREEIARLKVEKSTLEEANAREKREVEHMVGLERKRAEHDRDNAIREVKLAVREENLAAERERFDREMEFREERFTSEVGYLKDLMEKILERLPTVSVSQRTTSGDE